MSGFHYFARGFSLALRPGIKRYVILPLLINLFILGSAFYYLFSNLDSWVATWLSGMPDWLHWLDVVLVPLLVIGILVISAYFFSTLTHIIAAPFNGLLSEKLERQLSDTKRPEGGFVDFAKDIPRMLGREFEKIGYYLPRALALILLTFIPVIGQILAPLLWFGFGAWMIAIQYLDYPFDNHKVPFRMMRRHLAAPYSTSLSFGSCVMLCTMVPILNIFIMPVAVCGATALWVEKYDQQVSD